MKEYFDRLYRKGFEQFIEEMEYSLENEKVLYRYGKS